MDCGLVSSSEGVSCAVFFKGDCHCKLNHLLYAVAQVQDVLQKYGIDESTVMMPEISRRVREIQDRHSSKSKSARKPLLRVSESGNTSLLQQPTAAQPLLMIGSHSGPEKDLLPGTQVQTVHKQAEPSRLQKRQQLLFGDSQLSAGSGVHDAGSSVANVHPPGNSTDPGKWTKAQPLARVEGSGSQTDGWGSW